MKKNKNELFAAAERRELNERLEALRADIYARLRELIVVQPSEE